MNISSKISIGFFTFFSAFTLAAEECWALKINFISDIHAGKAKERDYSKYESGNIVFPIRYEENLNKVKKEVNAKNVSFTIDLGDSANNGNCKYSMLVKKIYKNFKDKVYYARGNHDSKSCFKKLSKDRYYTIDRDGWKVIVLDNASASGNIDTAQLDWLKSELESGTKAVIAAHFAPKPELISSISSYSNIKYIVHGNTHVGSGGKTANGVKYISVPALSLKGHQGSYKILSI